MSHACQEYGVTVQAIRKRIRMYGLIFPLDRLYVDDDDDDDEEEEDDDDDDTLLL